MQELQQFATVCKERFGIEAFQIHIPPILLPPLTVIPSAMQSEPYNKVVSYLSFFTRF